MEFVGILEKVGILGKLENLVACGGRKEIRKKGKEKEIKVEDIFLDLENKKY